MIFILQGSLYLCRCAVTCYRCCSVTEGKCSRTCWREIFSNSYFGESSSITCEANEWSWKEEVMVNSLFLLKKCFHTQRGLLWFVVSRCYSCFMFADKTKLKSFCCEFVAQTSLTAGAVRGSDQKVKRCWGYWLLICDIILVCTVCVGGCVSV